MELMSLSEDEILDEIPSAVVRFKRRMNAWRRTILLFHCYNQLSGGYEGPFHAAGYKDYVIESLLSPIKAVKDDPKPDIAAWDNERRKGLIVEITTNPNNISDKIKQLSRFKENIDISSLSQYGGVVDSGYDVVLSQLKFYKENISFCQVEVGEKFDARNEQLLSDETLKEKIVNFKKHSLVENVPEISIALHPEMSGSEIRVGIAALVMSLFKSDRVGMTVREFTDRGLERISEKISVSEKEKLQNKVASNLETLVKYYLGGYLLYDKKTEMYQKTPNGEKVSQYFASKKAVMLRLQYWIDEKTPSNDQALRKIEKEIEQTKLDVWLDEVDDLENLL